VKQEISDCENNTDLYSIFSFEYLDDVIISFSEVSFPIPSQSSLILSDSLWMYQHLFLNLQLPLSHMFLHLCDLYLYQNLRGINLAFFITISSSLNEGQFDDKKEDEFDDDKKEDEFDEGNKFDNIIDLLLLLLLFAK
jgi:hypothetical protein